MKFHGNINREPDYVLLLYNVKNEKHGIWDMLLILIKLKIRIVKNKMVKIKNAKN